MLKLAIEYLALSFLTNIGVLQLAAVHKRSLSISFFQENTLNYIFAFITIVPPLFFFFIWNDIHEIGIIEGAQQTYLFFGAFILALIITLIVSSFTEPHRAGFIFKLNSYLQSDNTTRQGEK